MTWERADKVQKADNLKFKPFTDFGKAVRPSVERDRKTAQRG